MKMKIEGLDKVLNSFDKVDKETFEKMYDEMILTGLMIETGYKTHVLVDTGRLRSSIWTKHKRNKNFSYSNSLGEGFNGDLQYEPKDNEVVVGTNVNYAIYVEERWKNYALTKAFERETRGLPDRLKKILK